jgi:hypothetical protein
LAEFVRARDHRCIFPGCSRPADACDIDHHNPYPDGPTSAENLGCLCRHHHRLKHEGGWSLDRVNGVYVWTTPPTSADGRCTRSRRRRADLGFHAWSLIAVVCLRVSLLPVGGWLAVSWGELVEPWGFGQV